jgi:hypothetical protein
MVFYRSMSMIKNEARKNVHYQGFGGEAFVPSSGLAEARNVWNGLREGNGLFNTDVVPSLGNYLSLRGITRQFTNDSWESGKGEGHGWAQYKDKLQF